MRIHIGSDPAGDELRNTISTALQTQGFEVVDTYSPGIPGSDYPDTAHPISKAVANASDDLGILICGTGIGMSMAANRHHGIRAALCFTELHARLAREHNHANILCLGARMTGTELALAIVQAYLSTPGSEAERHLRRIGKIDPLS